MGIVSRKIWGVVALLLAPAAMASDGWNVEDTGLPYTTKTITTTEGTWMSVDVSPDGKTLVFDMLGDIYSIPATGGTATLLFGGPALERMPRFSPDGKQILFLSDKSGSDNVWTAKPDGSDARAVTFETVDVLAGPTWGPDGQYVIATQLSAAYENLNTSSIKMYHTGGGAGRELVPSPGSDRNVQEAQLSPDGRFLYFTAKTADPHTSFVFVDANHTNFAVMRRDMESGETIPLIGGFGGALTPQISPDGRSVAFVRRVKTKTVLFHYDIETGKQTPIYDNLDRDLQAEFIAQGTFYPQYGWFPDNKHVAIWGKGKLYKVNMTNGDVAEIPFVASAEHRLTKATRVAHDLAPDRVTAHAVRQIGTVPGGKDIVFHALGTVWKQAAAGTGTAKRLTKGTGLEFEPSLSPDGKQVAYVERQDETGSNLQIVPLAGGKPVSLHQTQVILREPSFSPDGKDLLFRVEAAGKCLGGYGADVGLFTVNIAKGNMRKIMADGEDARYAPDGTRIYFTSSSWGAGGAVTKLESVNTDGFDRRTHGVAYGSDITEVKISPDLKWIAFKEKRQYYVMPYRETGSPVTISAAGGGVFARQLTVLSGYDIEWAPDSKSLYWVLGQSLYQSQITDTGHGIVTATLDASMPADKPQGLLAFTGARIITMRGDEVIENGTVLIDGNRIVAVGAAADIEVPVSAKRVDASGKTIMPGLINMHGHLEECYYSSTGLLPQKQPSHYASVAFGVTTNYDPYATEVPSYAMTEMRTAGVMVGPRTISVGGVAFGRAGKGDPVYEPIFSLDDARHLMVRKKALGGTIIKSYRQPMRSQRQMLIKAGHEAGVMVDVEGESHFYNNTSAVLDGHTMLEHNFPVATLYDDMVQLLAAGDTANTPTIIALFGELMGENYYYERTRAWEDPRIISFAPQVNSGYSALGTPYGAPMYARGMTTLHVADELWDIGFRSVARSIARADKAGARINAGSHGQIQGLGMHWEMWLMAEGGMENHRVLKAATMNGAASLGLDKQLGSLEVGKLADMIILDKDPLVDIMNTNTVQYSVVNGRVYDPYSMNEIIRADKPRSRFFWEVGTQYGIDWNQASSED